MRGLLGLGSGVKASSFNPNDGSIAGLILDLDASRGVTHPATVTAWADQSASAGSWTLLDGGPGPAYSAAGGPNSLPCITFSALEMLANDSFAALMTTAMTAFVVKKSLDNSGVKADFHTGHGASVGYSTGAQGGQRYIASWSASICHETTIAATTNWEVWTAVQSNTPSAALRVNGAALTVDTPAQATTASSGRARVGAFAPGAYEFNGSIHRILIWNSALNGPQIATVEAYLRTLTAIW